MHETSLDRWVRDYLAFLCLKKVKNNGRICGAAHCLERSGKMGNYDHGGQYFMTLKCRRKRVFFPSKKRASELYAWSEEGSVVTSS